VSVPEEHRTVGGVQGLEAGIVTPSADDLARFYLGAFGFAVSARLEFPQGVVVRLRRGDAALKLFQPAEGAQAVDRPRPWHRDAGFAYGALHVADVESAHALALEHGATSMAGPTAHRPGARYALVADPEGTVWELLEEPG
jgi:uncharacterized glyoxalase superfamily protein PhnB